MVSDIPARDMKIAKLFYSVLGVVKYERKWIWILDFPLLHPSSINELIIFYWTGQGYHPANSVPADSGPPFLLHGAAAAFAVRQLGAVAGAADAQWRGAALLPPAKPGLRARPPARQGGTATLRK